MLFGLGLVVLASNIYILVLAVLGYLSIELHGESEHPMNPGDCMGFKAGAGVASQLVNRSSAPVVYLEVGDRTVGDEVDYPDDDLKAAQQTNGRWLFTHNDGRPY